MNEAVVDASVAAKWVVNEDHSTQAAGLLGWRARHAPDHWLAEASNVLWSKVFRGDLTGEAAAERMRLLLRAPILTTRAADLLPRAFAISVARMVTVYDSLYVALAERLDIPLVTADRRLINRLSADPVLAARVVWVGDLAS